MLPIIVSWLAIIAPTPASTQTPVADEIHWTITGQTSVTFDWRGMASVIRYGITSTYGQEVTAGAPSHPPFSSAGPFWEARVSGLEENTVYHYSIGGGADHTFKTPLRRGNSDFTVIAQGDIGESRAYSSMSIVQSMVAAERPDFVLALGDLTYGNRHGQAAVDQHFNEVMVWSQDAAYMPAWGNHEWDYPAGDDLRNYKGRFDLPNPQTSPGSPSVSCCGEDWSWFDYGNARFIAYPDVWAGAWRDWFSKASAIMDAAQADPAIAYIVTYGHRPGYSTGNYSWDTRLRPFIDTLGVRHSKYVLNLTGHDHNYQRSKPQRGVTHITSGIGGAGLYSLGTAASFTAFQIVHHGVLRLRFTQAGIAGRAICGPPGGAVTCVQGSAMDTFFIANPNPDRPPMVAAPASVRAAPGQLATIAVTASDPDGEPIAALTVETAGLAASFAVDPSNSSGTFTWTPGVADTGRSHRVTFSASNALSNSVTTAIDVAGSDRPPVVTAPNVVLAVPGARINVAVHALDPDGEPITSLEADLSGLPPDHDATFVTVPGDSAGTLSWTPGSADVRTETYAVTFIASNALGGTDTTAIRVKGTPTTVEKRIVGGSDDAEESASGSVSLTGSDLELVTDSSVQVVGLRFTGLAIPPWAQVTSAYVQFKADESHSGATSLTFQGQTTDNAPVFTSASRNVSSRVRTAASVSWTPPAWTSPIGQAGLAQRTPDLAPVIQEIVGRAGWQSGNALALTVTGTGRRTAESYEGDAPGAPLLHVEFIAGSPVNQPPVVDAGVDGSVTFPADAFLDGMVSEDGLPSGILNVDWSVVTGPGTVTFTGGAGVVDTRASFSAAGSYVLRLTASDGALTANDTVSVVASVAGSVPVIVEKRVLAGSDDAEESGSGSVALTSSDLELVTDGSVQVVGLRFTALAIPPGSQVTQAYVQFKVNESHSGATALTIRGQAADSAAAFTSASRNVSSRTRTAATVSWTPPAWTTIGQAGAGQRTSDLAAVIQEIVGRAGWRSGNALALIVTGTGRRTAEAYEGEAAGAALLHVEMAAPLVNAFAGQEHLGDGSRDSMSSGARDPSELQFPPIRGALGARVIPNPMHGEGTLQLVTAHAGAARVELFDAAGRRVRVLLDTDYLAAGVHAFPVRAADGGAERLAPGVYFYRARVRGGVGSGRFLILD